MQFQLKAQRISLAQVFSKMEQVVEVLAIEDYSVSQTTLDNVSVSQQIRDRRRRRFYAQPSLSFQVFVNFAKKQSDNLEQQVAPPPGAGPSPLQRLISVLKSRRASTELSALISQAPDELESDDDEGLISFEEERVRAPYLVQGQRCRCLGPQALTAICDQSVHARNLPRPCTPSKVKGRRQEM